MKPHRGTLILVLGILSLVMCGIFTGIPAWLMGNGDLKEMEAGTMDRSGEQLTKIGKILGMISVGLTAVSCLIGIIMSVMGVGLGIATGK